MTNDLKRLVAAAGITTACLVGLTACGGSSDGPRDDGLTDMQRQDQAASASITGLINFGLAVITSMTGDGSEPRAMDSITPPASEAVEPTPLS